MLLCTTYRIVSGLDGACIPPDAMHFFVGGFWLLCVAPLVSYLSKKVSFSSFVVFLSASINQPSISDIHRIVLTVRTKSRGAKGQTHRQYVDRRRLRTCNTTQTKHNFATIKHQAQQRYGISKKCNRNHCFDRDNKNNWPDNSKA